MGHQNFAQSLAQYSRGVEGVGVLEIVCSVCKARQNSVGSLPEQLIHVTEVPVKSRRMDVESFADGPRRNGVNAAALEQFRDRSDDLGASEPNGWRGAGHEGFLFPPGRLEGEARLTGLSRTPCPCSGDPGIPRRLIAAPSVAEEVMV